jgi:Methyltransferase domain/galactosyl transferase GMA12/MNN10 family
MPAKIALVTLATPNIRRYAISTGATKQRYCVANGYDYIAFNEKLDDRPAAWSKLLALLRAMASGRYEWLCWMDADALVMNQTIRLESMIDGRADLLIATGPNGAINSGCFLLNCTQRSFEFLHMVYGKTDYLNHRNWEQAAMKHVLDRGLTSLTVRFIPPRCINSRVNGATDWRYHPGDFAIHLPGLSNPERVHLVNKLLLGTEFRSRTQLAAIVSQRSHIPLIGAEVGVQRGNFSDYLLTSSNYSRFYCIDAWKEIPGQLDIANVCNQKQDNLFIATQNRLRRYGDKVCFIRKASTEAAMDIPDASLDFVYIDADHSYEGCLADLKAYYPKLKQGGVLAGHDYLNGKLPEGEFGVRRAVEEFLSALESAYLFTTNEKWPTWLTFKI